MPFLSATQYPGERGRPFQFHPRVFSLVRGWLAEGKSPVVTEINLDAVAANRSQFNPDEVKFDGEWTRSPGQNGAGLLWYRVLKYSPQSMRYTVEYQESAGGSLSLAAVMEVSLEIREIVLDGRSEPTRVLRVWSYRTK